MKKNTKTIIFDGQVFQSDAWHRGMGKYSLELIKAILAINPEQYAKTYIVFSKHLKLEDEARQVIEKVAPTAELVYLNLKSPRDSARQPFEPIQAYNKGILESFINDQELQQPDFMILSLFIDQACSVFPDNARKILLFYDLIPLQYSDRYGQARSYTNYLRRFSTVFAADLVLTISQTVADDLVVYTGLSPAKVKNIDGAPIPRGQQKGVKPKDFAAKRFVLMPSGNDLRKNNVRAVQGFEEYRNISGDNDAVLVLTSYFDDRTKSGLLQLSNNIIFTGNVAEAELRWLYENAEAMLFVSEYEGLGLPVLEALEVNLPVVCSSLTVFSEMSDTAFYYSDERNPSSIATALQKGLRREAFEAKQEEYPAILGRYTWQNTANAAMQALSDISDVVETAQPKPKIAVFAPNPTGYSAIGKVVLLMHEALSEVFDVNYYLEDGRTKKDFSRPSYLRALAPTYSATEFTARAYQNYDAVIYHIGNSEYHVESIKNALYLPGFMILHDTKLQGVFEGELLRFSHMPETRVAAERRLNELSGSTKVSYLTSLINAQLGILTHSNYANSALKPINYSAVPISTTNLPVGTPQMSHKKHSETFKVGFGGIIHQAKGIALVDDILNSPDLQGVEIHIFGVPIIEPAILERLAAHPNVEIQQNLSDFEFESKLADMDAVISYRPSYNGETSLTVIEAMRYGVVPIVRKIGWFDELPDDCVQKVKSEDEVVAAISMLKRDPTLLHKKSAAAKKLMQEHFDYKQYAQTLQQMVKDAEGNSKNPNTNIAKILKSNSSKQTLRKTLEETNED